VPPFLYHQAEGGEADMKSSLHSEKICLPRLRNDERKSAGKAQGNK
jgi:hypothetical protein